MSLPSPSFYLIMLGKYPNRLVDSAWSKKADVERRVIYLNHTFEPDEIAIMHMKLNNFDMALEDSSVKGGAQ